MFFLPSNWSCWNSRVEVTAVIPLNEDETSSETSEIRRIPPLAPEGQLPASDSFEAHEEAVITALNRRMSKRHEERMHMRPLVSSFVAGYLGLLPTCYVFELFKELQVETDMSSKVNLHGSLDDMELDAVEEQKAKLKDLETYRMRKGRGGWRDEIDSFFIYAVSLPMLLRDMNLVPIKSAANLSFSDLTFKVDVQETCSELKLFKPTDRVNFREFVDWYEDSYAKQVISFRISGVNKWDPEKRVTFDEAMYALSSICSEEDEDIIRDHVLSFELYESEESTATVSLAALQKYFVTAFRLQRLHGYFAKNSRIETGLGQGLGPDELRAVLNFLGMRLDNKDIQTLFYDLDMDHNQQIQWHEFLFWTLMTDDPLHAIDESRLAPEVTSGIMNSPSQIELDKATE